MPDFLHSPVITHIFNYVLAATWQSALLFLVVAMLCWCLRQRHASVRRLIWLVAIVLAPLLPLISAQYSNLGVRQNALTILPQASIAPQAEPDHVSHANGQSLPQDIKKPDAQGAEPSLSVIKNNAPLSSLWPWLAFAYVVGFVLFMTVALIGVIRIRRWTIDASPITDPAVLRAFADAQMKIGLKHPCFLLAGDEVPGPVSVGIFNFRILLPKHVIQNLNSDELNQLALHETAHLARQDPLSFAVVAVLRAVFYFNPLFWIASREFIIAAEQCADQAVVEDTQDANAYTALLVKMADSLTNSFNTTELAAGILLNKSVFIQRAEALLEKRGDQAPLSLTLLFSMLTFVTVVLHIILLHPLTAREAAPLAIAKEGVREKSKMTRAVAPPSSQSPLENRASYPLNPQSIEQVSAQLGLSLPITVDDFGSRYLKPNHFHKSTYFTVTDSEGSSLTFCLSRGGQADYPGSWYLHCKHPRDEGALHIPRGSAQDDAIIVMLASWLDTRFSATELKNFIEDNPIWPLEMSDELIALGISEVLDAHRELAP